MIEYNENYKSYIEKIGKFMGWHLNNEVYPFTSDSECETWHATASWNWIMDVWEYISTVELKSVKHINLTISAYSITFQLYRKDIESPELNNIYHCWGDVSGVNDCEDMKEVYLKTIIDYIDIVTKIEVP